MATDGEGTSAPTSSAYEGGAGAGGKFAKRFLRKTRSTPYDRPPTALRNPSWISKLVVDPASKLISSSANLFFSSLFSKRLPPPPPPSPPESNPGFSDRGQDPVIHHEVPQAAAADFQKSTSGNSQGILELEQLLKQKTFTRSEIDRLTDLLRSKVADETSEGDVERPETGILRPVTDNQRHQQSLENPFEENRIERERSHGLILSPATSARVLDEDIASPAELAKAYMDSRPSKISPSALSFRGQAFREDGNMVTSVSFTPKSMVLPLAAKPAGHLDHRENGFTTPRSRGRSAIYNMARTPYTRAYPTAFGKAGGSGGLLLPSPGLLEQDGKLGSKKPAQKRGSSVLDDIGSVGPIRRIRQKQGLISNKVAVSSRGKDAGDFPKPLSLNQNHSFMHDWKHKGSGIAGNDINSPSTSYYHVPPKSSEMAARILEQLEKISPKGKSAESEPSASKESPASKLTTDMLSGQALKSFEHVDSSKMLQSPQDYKNVEDAHKGGSAGVRDNISWKRESTGQNGPGTLRSQGEMTPLVNGDATVSVQPALLVSKPSAFATISEAQPFQKNRAFMMSAHEVSLDLDDETYCNGPLPERKGEPDMRAASQDFASVNNLEKDKPPTFAEVRKTPPNPVCVGTTELENRREGAGFAFSVPPLSKPTMQTVKPPSVSAFEKPNEAGESSSLASVAEGSDTKASLWMQPPPQSLFRSGGVTDLPVQIPGTGDHDANILPGAAKEKEEPKNLLSNSFGFSIPGSMPSFSLPDSSNMKHGSLNVIPSVLSASTLISAGVGNQALTSFEGGSAASSNITASVATTSLSSIVDKPLVSSLPPSLPLVASLQSGFSGKTSTAVSSTSAASGAEAESQVAKSEMEKESKAGSSISSFGGTSFALATSGSSIFGLSSTAKSLPSESISNVQSSGLGPGSGSTTVSQSIPFQFSSSTPSSTFGASGVASVAPNSAPFSSSAPVTELFGSVPSSGISSSSSSLETKSLASSTVASPSAFGFGLTASSGASSVNPISASIPNIFSAGMGSSAIASVNNVVGSTGGVTSAPFIFGAMSSSSNISSSSAGATDSNFGSSLLSSSAETGTVNNSGANSNAFGLGWQTPKPSSSVATFNSLPSTGFSFGASSSSFTSTNNASMGFGSSVSASSTPAFSFTTTSFSTSSFPSFGTSPMFGNSASTFAVTGNSDQMNTEDSMAEDPVQSSGIPAFGQQPAPSPSPSPSPGGFVFGSTAPSPSPFQFGGQPSQAAPQSSPFQASGSLDFNAGGSFSLGSGGEKAGRKFIKVNRNKQRKR